MTYVGATPTTGDFKLLDSITTSSTTTFNLRHGGAAIYPQSANHCIVQLNGVNQVPGSSFNIVNDTIVFASSLSSSDVINQILVLGNVNDIGVPSDDTITAAKLNNSAISGLSALAATPDDTDELMISDGGTLKKIDYSYLKSTVVNRPNAKPLLINADFSVMQRDSSAISGQTSLGGVYKNFDRWYYHLTDVGTWTIEKGTGPTDQGLRNSLKFDNTTADTSLDATSLLAISQCIEAQDAQMINCGNSNAEKITVGFWVKATKTGTNVLELLQNDSDRICCQTYSVSSSDTWEFKVVNFPADTSGSGINNDNGAGLSIRFYLAAGSNFSSGTLATTWAARSNVNRAPGQINHADSTSNNFEIAGVQLEVGEYTSSTIPPFQHESYGDNLLRCQRYFYKIGGAYKGLCIAWTPSGTEVATELNFPVTMRSTPSVTVDASNFEFRRSNNSAYTLTDDTPAMSFVTPEGGSMWFTEGSVGNSSGTNVGVVRSISSANDHFKFSSEL